MAVLCAEYIFPAKGSQEQTVRDLSPGSVVRFNQVLLLLSFGNLPPLKYMPGSLPPLG